jgi:hypothetical protein
MRRLLRNLRRQLKNVDKPTLIPRPPFERDKITMGENDRLAHGAAGPLGRGGYPRRTIRKGSVGAVLFAGDRPFPYRFAVLLYGKTRNCPKGKTGENPALGYYVNSLFLQGVRRLGVEFTMKRLHEPIE